MSARSEHGFTLIELLVSIGIVGVIFAGLVQQYSFSVASAHDHSIRIAAQVQAQAIAQTISSELRTLGNGVPFDQANFQIGESTLSDPTVTEPIQVATAAEDHIAFRLNESGEVYMLAADFDPAISLTVTLTHTTGLDVNDPIYMSNSVVSGDDGLFATVAAVDHSSHTVTLNAGPIMSPAAKFDKGSILEEVPLVTYVSAADGSGITRDSGFGSVLMGKNATFTVEYLDSAGTVLTLPLTNEMVVNSLRVLRVTIAVTSEKPLTTGEPFTARVVQNVGIRNLNYFY